MLEVHDIPAGATEGHHMDLRQTLKETGGTVGKTDGD